MDSLYRTPVKNSGRARDSDEVTAYFSPSKMNLDSRPERWRNPTPTSTALPNSNRDNVVDALKNIQDRIRTLELERNSAEENLKDLSDETARYRRLLEKARSPRDNPSRGFVSPRDEADRRDDAVGPLHSRVSPLRSARSPYAGTSPRDVPINSPTARLTTNHDLHEQLRSADTRCELLDKQLEYMRRMLNEAEAEKRLAVERNNQMLNMRTANTEQEFRQQMDKVRDMEKEHKRLQASQHVAQNRIRELEREIERSKRSTDRSRVEPPTTEAPKEPLTNGELRSAKQSNKILVDKLSPPSSPRRSGRRQVEPERGPARDSSGGRPTRGPRRSKSGRRSAPVSRSPTSHYHLNMADIPFVVGQSTAPSHRLGSNLQKLIATMKQHNPKLCAAVSEARPRSTCGAPVRRSSKRRAPRSSTSTESDGEMDEMVGQLIEEYTHLGAEHMELTRQLEATPNERLRDQIQSELDQLQSKMNIKAEQIAKLSQFRAKIRLKPRRSKAKSESDKSAAAARLYKAPSSSTTGEVQVTTTIKTRGKAASGKIIESRPKSREGNLKTLQNTRSLTTKLQTDQVHWTS